jgi:Tfp pilus assembly protein PilX
MLKENQKGISIYLVVVMMSVLLAIVLGLATLIIGGSKMTRNMSYSVKAFHAADTGIEKALYNIKFTSGTCDDSSSDGTFATDYNYDVTMSNSGGDCSNSGTLITSVGQYQTVKRSLEVTY